MRIGILGPLEVRADGRPLEIGGARLRALLALLALEAGRTVPAERLIDDLWEDRPPAGAVNALQSLVSRLRATFGRYDDRLGPGGARDLIESRPSGYRLALSRSEVDAFDFEARVAVARRSDDPARTGRELRAALSLWRGPALADFQSASFAEIPVARLEALRLTATEERVEADLALGRHAELIPELEALAAAHPTRERPHGQLMRALYAVGRQADALSVHADIQRTLVDSLGVDPGPELADIHLAVLRRDPRLMPATGHSDAQVTAPPRVARRSTPPSGRPGAGPAAPAPPAPPVPSSVPSPPPSDEARPDDARPDGSGAYGRSPARRTPADPPRTNLRSRLTSFIGRDEDLEEVARMLAGTRLVTLTGPGGAGKTRLAIEVAEPLIDRMPDGVWFVDLSAVTDPAEVPHAVLTVLGLREMVALAGAVGRIGTAEAGDALDRLAAVLTAKRLVLLLDNCEHLIHAAAGLADRLLADCPGVRILATSREPLGITGESQWPVESLPSPPEHAGVDEAMACPAVRLLADRARAVRPGFAVSAGNVSSVTRICRALDGMPLAIELAAARLRALTADQIAARLDDRFRLLATGSRTALPRHQTLRAVVEWSWDLLDDAERMLWCRLSVFSGGATVESAEAVCAGPGLPAADVLDTLTALVDKSLVVVVTDEQAGAEPRYRMLETIRAFGLERLADAGIENRARRAHAAYFLALAERAEPELRGHGQVRWLGRLTTEHENLHAAFRYAVAAGEAMPALRLCAALGWYWFLRGHRAEAIDAIDTVLALPVLPEDPVTALVYGYGVLTMLGETNDLDPVRKRMRRALEIMERTGAELTHPLMRFLEPLFVIFGGSMTEPELHRVEPIMADPDPWLRAMGHFIYAQASINAGRIDRVDEHFEAALAGFRSVGDRWGMAFSLSGQAEVHAWRGEHRASVARFEESLRLMAELGTMEDGPYIFMRLSNELWLLGEEDRATELLTTSLRMAERTGLPASIAAVHYQLGEFARRRGAPAEALDRLERALYLIGDLQGPLQFHALIHTAMGLVHSAQGEAGRAAEHHTTALAAAVSSWDAPVIAAAVTGFADLALRDGQVVRAAELLGAAEGIRGMPDLSSPEPQRLTELVSSAAGAEAFTAASERGRRMTAGDVLDLLRIERPPTIPSLD